MLYDKFIYSKASWSFEVTLSWLVKVKMQTAGEILFQMNIVIVFAIMIDKQHFPPMNCPKEGLTV